MRLIKILHHIHSIIRLWHFSHILEEVIILIFKLIVLLIHIVSHKYSTKTYFYLKTIIVRMHQYIINLNFLLRLYLIFLWFLSCNSFSCLFFFFLFPSMFPLFSNKPLGIFTDFNLCYSLPIFFFLKINGHLYHFSKHKIMRVSFNLRLLNLFYSFSANCLLSKETFEKQILLSCIKIFQGWWYLRIGKWLNFFFVKFVHLLFYCRLLIIDYGALLLCWSPYWRSLI